MIGFRNTRYYILKKNHIISFQQLGKYSINYDYKMSVCMFCHTIRTFVLSQCDSEANCQDNQFNENNMTVNCYLRVVILGTQLRTAA